VAGVVHNLPGTFRNWRRDLDMLPGEPDTEVCIWLGRAFSVPVPGPDYEVVDTCTITVAENPPESGVQARPEWWLGDGPGLIR
jgi:hypothetical protein